MLCSAVEIAFDAGLLDSISGLDPGTASNSSFEGGFAQLDPAFASREQQRKFKRKRKHRPEDGEDSDDWEPSGATRQPQQRRGRPRKAGPAQQTRRAAEDDDVYELDPAFSAPNRWKSVARQAHVDSSQEQRDTTPLSVSAGVLMLILR